MAVNPRTPVHAYCQIVAIIIYLPGSVSSRPGSRGVISDRWPAGGPPAPVDSRGAVHPGGCCSEGVTHGRSRPPGSHPVCPHGDVSLPLSAIDHWHGGGARLPRGHVSQDRKEDLRESDPVLGQDLRAQLRNRCGHRHCHGVPVRHELGDLLAIRGRRVRLSALAAEGIFAFFLESGFLAVLVFGWDRVGPRMHFFSTIMVCLGSIFSSVWIVVANSWQQTPAGHHIVQVMKDGQAVEPGWPAGSSRGDPGLLGHGVQPVHGTPADARADRIVHHGRLLHHEAFPPGTCSANGTRSLRAVRSPAPCCWPRSPRWRRWAAAISRRKTCTSISRPSWPRSRATSRQVRPI